MFDNAEGQITDALQYYKLNYEPKDSGELKMGLLLNPIALRVAKTLWSFGHSECNGVIENVSPKEELILLSEADLHRERMHRRYRQSALSERWSNGRHSWVISLSNIHPPRLENKQ